MRQTSCKSERTFLSPAMQSVQGPKARASMHFESFPMVELLDRWSSTELLPEMYQHLHREDGDQGGRVGARGFEPPNSACGFLLLPSTRRQSRRCDGLTRTITACDAAARRESWRPS